MSHPHPHPHPHAVLMRRGWTPQRLLIGVGLVLLAMLACYRAWDDILTIAYGDEEASQVWLVPFVVAWLVWVRWPAVRKTRPTYTMLGPALIAVGVVISEFGSYINLQIAWHGGAVLVLFGAIATVIGPRLLWRMWPAVLVLGFLIPVPGSLRLKLSMPLQEYTAGAAYAVFQLLGLDVDRVGNLLVYNGQQVLVAEACNGMRMMFALVLVAYAFAFGTPLRPSVRAMILILSPIAAVVCNVIRVVPTVWLYGQYPDSAGPIFHTFAGWAMLAVAFLLLMGFVRMLRWAEVPVMQPQASLAAP